jgi:D-3-phosphoglycerate dehydrogenase
MNQEPHWIFDFDSTFVRVEALDELADIALAGRADRDAVLASIREITNLGMEGRLAIDESLRRRMNLLAIHPDMLPKLVGRLVESLTPSFSRGLDRLRSMRERVWIVSGGFHEWIDPVAEAVGLRRDRVIANRLRARADGLLEIDPAASPCAVDAGKANAIRAAGVPRPRVMVGDGITDWQVREHGACERFVCLTEVVRREPVASRADVVATNLDEVLAAAAGLRESGQG